MWRRNLKGMNLYQILESVEKRISGYRGTGAKHSFGSSEGIGLYVAKDKSLAKFFGDIKKVSFTPLKKPFNIFNEPLLILTEDDELEEPIKDGDSDWFKYCKKSFQLWEKSKKKWDAELVSKHLTELLKKDGYDGTHVKSNKEEWFVLFYPNKHKVEIKK